MEVTMFELAIREKPKLRFTKAIQDYYPDSFANCFGCGRNNSHGLHTKTHWDPESETGICRFKPKEYHCGYKVVFHGGLISSVIECNSVATAIAATYEAEDLDPENDHVFYVLGSINARFIRPIPIDSEVFVQAQVIRLEEKKAVCEVSVIANETQCSKAETVVIRVPNRLILSNFIDQ